MNKNYCIITAITSFNRIILIQAKCDLNIPLELLCGLNKGIILYSTDAGQGKHKCCRAVVYCSKDTNKYTFRI